jgi:flagellar protein FlbD
MIEVNKLNGAVFMVNPDLIRYIEATPDTVLTFTDGQKISVKNPPKEIVDRIVRYRRSCVGAVVKE